MWVLIMIQKPIFLLSNTKLIKRKENKVMVNLCFDSDGVIAKWGKSFEATFLPGYFRTGVEPDITAITAVRSLFSTSKAQENFRVFILSARYDDSESPNGFNRFENDKKGFYCDNRLGEVPALFVPCGQSKREALRQIDCSKDDWFILCDDHTPNLIDWEKGGPKFIGIKWLNGINGSKKSGFEGLCIPADRMSAQSIYVTLMAMVKYYG